LIIHARSLSTGCAESDNNPLIIVSSSILKHQESSIFVVFIYLHMMSKMYSYL